jgi:hypothetical protein
MLRAGSERAGRAIPQALARLAQQVDRGARTIAGGRSRGADEEGGRTCARGGTRRRSGSASTASSRRGAGGRCASTTCRRCAAQPISATRWRRLPPQLRAARSRPARRPNWLGSSRFSSEQSRLAISRGACGNWKSAVARARDTRLHCLIEEAAREDVADGFERYSQRAWRRVCAIVREELIRSGVEAARVEALLPRGASETRDLEGPDEELVLPVATARPTCSPRRFGTTQSDISRSNTRLISPMRHWRSCSPGRWRGASIAPGVEHELPGAGQGRSGAGSNAVNKREDLVAVVGTVGRHALPVAVIPQIGKEAGPIFMKMEKRLALQIEDPGPPLDEHRSRAKAFEQIGQRLERARTSVFHRSFPVHSEGSHRTRPVVRLKHSVPVVARTITARFLRHFRPFRRPGAGRDPGPDLDTGLRRYDEGTPVRCTICLVLSSRIAESFNGKRGRDERSRGL